MQYVPGSLQTPEDFRGCYIIPCLQSGPDEAKPRGEMDSANGEATTGAKRPFESANLEEEQGSNEILESSKVQAMPLKRFFRSRAHCNPLSHNDGFHYPLSPVSAGDRMICRNIFFDGSISKLSWLELGRSRRWVTLFVSAIVNSFKNMTTFSGWSLHYPLITDAERTVKFLDVGMGFGGLTVALAELYPEKLVLGMEIRAKVEHSNFDS